MVISNAPPQSTGPAISVIIPMYNTEKYIGECLDSLFLQTFQDYEIILIDDCSTDNSREVAESYVEKFGGRLKIYSNEKNSDVCITRNNGLMLSRGEYVYYMDSDDVLLLTGLEKIYTVAKRFNADFVNLSGFYEMSIDGQEIITRQKIKRVFENNTEEFFVDEDLKWRLQKPLTYRFMSPSVLRLSRRDFLIENQLFFPENVKRCEDILWKYAIFLCAKRIVHVPFIIYFYRMTANSKTRQKRTSAQYVNSRMTTVIDGIKWLDDIMSRIDFFAQNTQYRYQIIDEFTTELFRKLFYKTQKVGLPSAEVYEAIKQEFGEKLGKHDVLVSELCSLIDDQLKEIAKLEKKLRAS